MRWRFTILIACCIILGAVFTNACRKSRFDRFQQPTPINFSVPEGFPEPVYSFEENPLTEDGFALGRKLFHDNRLSKNIDVTCSSCHQQHAAYTTFDHDLGHGTNHQHTTRNVPVIFNMAWHQQFQWDGSVSKLEDQPVTCLTAPEKMGEEINSVIDKLNGLPEYKEMFGKAFGDDNITKQRLSLALTQFVASIVSAGSKYDKMKRGEAVFNTSEQNGYILFQQHCNSCHTEPLFTDAAYHNNGLSLNPFHADYGRMQVTGDPRDSLKFKTPTLRNVMLTGYFAHDGRFVAVSQMLDHYSDSVHSSATLDPLLVNKIPLTDLEKFYLQEFLFTLSDSTLISDPRFEAP